MSNPENPYISQGIATKAFGIEFRSKLEAQWAHWLEERYPGRWDYTDSQWHDFIIFDKVQVEVKPHGDSFLEQAISRAWKYQNQWRYCEKENKRIFNVFCGCPQENSAIDFSIDDEGVVEVAVYSPYKRNGFWCPEKGFYGFPVLRELS